MKRSYLLIAAGLLAAAFQSGPALADGVPEFKVDPFWPKPLPENWMLGQVSGIAVDKDDRIWIVHRPGTLVDDEKGALANPPATKCCKPAPPVLQFDAQGNLLKSWGGKGAGYDWPESEHGIHVDRQGNVWLAGNGPKAGEVGGSNNPTGLGRPAHMIVEGDELYVADGYANRRVAVYDARTLAYKRHWGAYGEKPHDDKLPPYDPRAALARSFGNPVHCVRISNDGLVYVCDRANDRIQVFEKSGKFVKEHRIEPETLQNGSVWDLVLSEDKAQRYIFVADGANNQMLVVERESGKVLSRFSRPGRMAGELKWVHNMAIDSKGNLYTAEVVTGRRAQKFLRVAQ
jgi:hypothetical protein